jgi:hypothetical protein
LSHLYILMAAAKAGKPPEGVPLPKSYVQRFKEWFTENISKPGRAMSAKDFSRSVRYAYGIIEAYECYLESLNSPTISDSFL